MLEKYYYRLRKGNEILFCAVDKPIKEEKLSELICMPDYTAKQITKAEYEKEAEQE